MDVNEIVTGLEKRATAAGLSINEACRAAGFHPATFYRWKSGESKPTFRLVEKLEIALAEAEASQVEGAA